MSFAYMCKLCLRFIFILTLIAFIIFSIIIVNKINDIYCCIYISIADGLAIYIIITYIRNIWKEYNEEYKDMEPIDQLTTYITTYTKTDIT